MKVVYFTKEYPPCIYGGAGVHVDYLSREMAKLCEVEVRTFCKESDVGDVEILNSVVWRDIFEGGSDKYLKSLEVLSEGISLLRKPIGGDIIHSHTWYTNLPALFGKILFEKPLVLTLHSLEPLRVWKKNQLGKGYNLSKWMERIAVINSDGVVAVSKSMKEDIVKIYGISEDRVEVIYNGIDEEFFKPTYNKEILLKYGIDPDSPYILFVGRITRQKGLDLLLEVFERGDFGDLQLVMCAGAADTDELRIEIENQVKRMISNGKRVLWIEKMVPKEDLVVLYSHALSFCCPSVYEPFGIINLEALSTNTPVIGSAVGGIVEIVEDGVDGFLIPIEVKRGGEKGFVVLNREEYIKKFGEKIEFFLRNHSVSLNMGKMGRKKVVERFSWKVVARNTFLFYKRILKI